jgi:ATP-dependent protease Clp ATPase subunit
LAWTCTVVPSMIFRSACCTPSPPTLLKIIEGTTVQVQAKPEKNPRATSAPNSYPSNSPCAHCTLLPCQLGLGCWVEMTHSPRDCWRDSYSAGKGEVYNVRTDNILFVFSGAFVGLHKAIMDRISRSSSDPGRIGSGWLVEILGEPGKSLVFDAGRTG